MVSAEFYSPESTVVKIVCCFPLQGQTRQGCCSAVMGHKAQGKFPPAKPACASRTCCALTFHTFSGLALAHASCASPKNVWAQLVAVPIGAMPSVYGWAVLWISKVKLHGCVQLGSLGFSPEMGINYLTSPQLRNVPVITHSLPWLLLLWEIRFRVM